MASSQALGIEKSESDKGWGLVRFLAEKLESLPKASPMDHYLAFVKCFLRGVGYTFRRAALQFEPICRPQEQARFYGAFVIFDERQPMHWAYINCPFAQHESQSLKKKAVERFRKMMSEEDLIDVEKLAYADLVEHAMFFSNAPVNAERQGLTIVLYPEEKIKNWILDWSSSGIDRLITGFELYDEDKRRIEARMVAEREAVGMARERILAFCMGAHARLGSDSLVHAMHDMVIMEIVRQFLLMHLLYE